MVPIRGCPTLRGSVGTCTPVQLVVAALVLLLVQPTWALVGCESDKDYSVIYTRSSGDDTDADIIDVSGHGGYRAYLPIFAYGQDDSSDKPVDDISPDTNCTNISEWEVGVGWVGLTGRCVYVGADDGSVLGGE